MLKITPIEGSPDQFTATLDNLDIFLINHFLKNKDVNRLDQCGCKKCLHAAKTLNEWKKAMAYIDEHQSMNLNSKMIMMEHGGDNRGPIQILKDLGLVP